MRQSAATKHTRQTIFTTSPQFRDDDSHSLWLRPQTNFSSPDRIGWDRENLLANSSDLPKNELGNQFLHVNGRLGILNSPPGFNDLLRSPRCDFDILFTHQAPGLDGSNGIFSGLLGLGEIQGNMSLIIIQRDACDASDIDAGDFNR